MASVSTSPMTHRYNLELPEVYRGDISGEAVLLRRALVSLAKSDWAAPDDDARAVWDGYTRPEERAMAALEKGVHKCLDLKYPLHPEDYALIVRSLLRGCLSSSVEIGMRSKLARAAMRLMSKRECEIPGGVPWKAVVNAILEMHVECMHGAPFTGKDIRDSHCKHLVHLLGKCVFYLPDGDNAEVVWNAFIEKIRLIEDKPDVAYLSFMIMSYVLPTRGTEWTGWTSEAMELLPTVVESPYWDALWASLFARTAKNQPNVVDWTPCIPILFKYLTLSLGLPLGSAAPHTPLKRSCPRHVYFLTHADLLDSIALFAVYALSPLQPTVRVYLERFLVLLENYCHPSNSGSWSGNIASVIQYITQTLVTRVSAERAATKAGVTSRILSDNVVDAVAPLEHRLNDAYVDGLVNLLLPTIKLGLFSKSSAMSRYCASAARDLAVLSPHLVVGPLLAVAEEGLTYISSPHRTSTSLKLLAALTPIFLDAEIFPSGAQSLPQALELTLPGIDPNDPSKTKATMLFIAGATARFRDLLETNAIPGLFSFLEDYVPSLLDRIFFLCGAAEAPAKKHRSSHSIQVPHSLLATTMENLFSSLPPAIVLTAAKRIAREISGSATSNAIKHYGLLVRISSAAAALAGGEGKNPSPDIFLSPLLGQLLDESDGKTVLSSLSEVELVWRIRMLAQACRRVGPGMEAYLPRLATVIRLTMEKRERAVYKAGGRLVRGILEGLTAIQVSYGPSTQSGSDDDVIRWKIPNPDNWSTALSFIAEFFSLAENMVYGEGHDPASKKIVMNRDVLFRALRLLHALQRGARWLCGGALAEHFTGLEKFENAEASESELQMTKSQAMLALRRPIHSGLGGEPDASTRERAAKLWRRLYELILSIGVTTLKERPDDSALLYRCLEPVELAGEPLKDTSASKRAHSALNLFKNAYKPLISFKRPHDAPGGVGRGMPSFILKRRIMIQQEYRMAYASRPGSNNASLLESFLDHLVQYSVNDFPRVRQEARGMLTRGLRCAHSKYRQTTLEKLIDSLGDTMRAVTISQQPVISEDVVTESVETASQDKMVDIVVKLDGVKNSSSDGMVSTAVKAKKDTIPYEKIIGLSSIIRSSALLPIVMRCVPLYDKLIRVMVHCVLVADRPDAISSASALYKRIMPCLRPHPFHPPKLLGLDLSPVSQIEEQGALSNPPEILETYNGLMSYLIGLLRNPSALGLVVNSGNSEKEQAHWRLQSLVASLLYVNIRGDRPPSFEVATFFGKGLISDVVSLRYISTKAILLILALHSLKPKERFVPYTNAPSNTRPWTGAPNSATRALDELIGSKDYIRKVIHTLALDHEEMESSGQRTSQSFVPGGYQSLMSFVSTYDSYLTWIVFGGQTWPKSKIPRSRDNISLSRVRLYEYLVRSFGNKGFDAFMGPTEELVTKVVDKSKGIISGVKDEEVRIIVGELVVGICRGAVLDTLHEQDAVIERVTGWMKSILSSLTGPQGAVNGGTLIRLITTTEPGCLGIPVSENIFDWITTDRPLIAPSDARSVARLQSRRLRYVHSVASDVTDASEVRIKRLLKEASGELVGNSAFAHDQKAVREEVAKCLTLFVACNDLDETVFYYMEDVAKQLVKSREESGMDEADENRMIVDDEAEDSEETVAKKLRSRLGETLSRFISLVYWGGLAEKFQPYLVTLLPSLFVSLDESDSTRVSHARLALSLAAQGKFTDEQLTDVITAVEAMSESSRWRIRAGVLPFTQVLAFMSQFVVDAKFIDRMRGVIVKLISDTQIEVRTAAAATIIPLIRDAPPEAVAAIREMFLGVVQSTQPPRRRGLAKRTPMSPDVTRRRHGAALGLGSLVKSKPYSVPPWMPSVLVALSNCIGDPPPISTTVKAIFNDFIRTHRDEWTEHKKAFTEEELEIVSDLLVSPSYYA